MKTLTDQHVNVFGHKVPLALLGVLATVAAALLLLRGSRNSQAQAASQQQASGSGVFGGASGSDISGTLQNLQSQLAGFSSGLSGLQSAGVVPAAPNNPGMIQVAPDRPPGLISSSGSLSPQISSAGQPPAPQPPAPPDSHSRDSGAGTVYRTISPTMQQRTGPLAGLGLGPIVEVPGPAVEISMAPFDVAQRRGEREAY